MHALPPPSPPPPRPQLIGHVLGHRGEIIKSIVQRSGCKLHLRTFGPDAPACDVEFTGTPAAVAAADDLVRQVNTPV